MPSVISHHISLTRGNIRDLLTSAGVVHPGSVYSGKEHKGVFCRSVLDYEECNFPGAYKERVKAKNNGHPEPGLATKIPVSFADNGNTMIYLSRRGEDNTPTIFLGEKFPETVFQYSCFYDKQLSNQYYFKGPKGSCTRDGRQIYACLSLDTSQIRFSGSFVRCFVQVDPKDHARAFFQVRASELYEDNKSFNYFLYITNPTREFLLGRTLENGEKVQETWSWQQLLDAVENCRDGFETEMEREENR